ncbi:MAG: hypothetical protein K6C36_06025 [Clostridia bacterium]|nr:hypothetical protein [Clostridia bacterium]
MFKITYESQDRMRNETARINAFLAADRLAGANIKECSAYLAATNRYNAEHEQVGETTYSLGFDRIILICEQKDKIHAHEFRIDTVVFPKGAIANSGIFRAMWTATHADRVMRQMIAITFEAADAFVVLHHEKAADRKTDDGMSQSEEKT